MDPPHPLSTPPNVGRDLPFGRDHQTRANLLFSDLEREDRLGEVHGTLTLWRLHPLDFLFGLASKKSTLFCQGSYTGFGTGQTGSGLSGLPLSHLEPGSSLCRELRAGAVQCAGVARSARGEIRASMSATLKLGIGFRCMNGPRGSTFSIFMA